IYLLALVLSLIYYVKMPGVIDARRTRERVADKELVTAGTSVSSTGDTIDADDVVLSDTELADKEAAADKWGGMTQSMIWVGAVTDVAAAVRRGLATGGFPRGNMYGYILVSAAVTMVGAAGALQRKEWRVVWPWLRLPILVLLFFGGASLYAVSAAVV